MHEQLYYSLLYGCFVSFVLTLWFKTNAFTEYFWFLPICKSYCEFKNKTGLHFTEYILYDKQTFLRRLLNCPYCVGFWLVLPCLCFLPITHVPLVYVFSQILFKQL